ncbi:hypothetical protein HMPREF9141_2214 [Prevotella multiformis DSM 16608]|uniref:Uncharacterized protein n=1 Tax=Prevotella multiformis DSM 16608 TaxID=888743 RepID=F0F9E7_9BACT|nr:hypothetical protein HMPREF9141_2214 [Prevotella multiformis DSM 16608]
MPHKSKDTKSGQIPCQRQTDAFFQNRASAEIYLHGKAYTVSSNQK